MIQSIKDRLSKATPGPYYWSDEFKDRDGDETLSLIAEGEGGYGILSCDGMANSPEQRDREFLENSWQDISYLLQEHTRLTEALKVAEEAIKDIEAMNHPYDPGEDWWDESDNIECQIAKRCKEALSQIKKVRG